MSGPRFAALPVDALDDRRLTKVDLAILNDLGRHADLRTGWCYRAQKTLAEVVGVSRRTIQRSLDRLLDLSYLDREIRLEDGKGQKSNLYRVLFEPTGPRGQLDLFVATPGQPQAAPKPKKMTTPPRHAHGVNDAPPASGAGGIWRTIERPSENDGCAVASASVDDRFRSSEPVPTRTLDQAGTVPSVDAPPRNQSVADTDDLLRRLRDAAGGTINSAHPAFLNLSEPFGWLAAGCDLDLDIVPVLRGFAGRHTGAPVRSWRYFAGAVADARDRRLSFAARLPTNVVQLRDAHVRTDPQLPAGRFAAAAAHRRSQFAGGAPRSEDGSG